MGFLDLFGKSELSAKKIAKIANLAANPYAQPDVRMREMQRLIDVGTVAAVRGVLKRLTTNASGHIADEDEKKWLEDALVDLGEVAVEPLKEFIQSQDKLTYALHAFERIVGEASAVEFFLSVLQQYGPEDYRSAEAKLQIILLLSDHLQDVRVLPALCPFLLDHSDEVRWAVIELVDRATREKALPKPAEEQVRKHLSAFVIEDDVGPRIQKRAAELFCTHEWSVETKATDLAPLLGEEYFLDKKRYVRRRAKVRD
jgi:HEAT repeat protein